MTRLLFCAFTLLVPTLSHAEQKPYNFIFILVDDWGWTDGGCFGSDTYETPNIDRLAAEGMKFTSGYAACTVCSPTRAAAMTGKYPARLRVTDWIAGHRRSHAKLAIPDWTKFLVYREVSIAEALKAAAISRRIESRRSRKGRRANTSPTVKQMKHWVSLPVIKTDPSSSTCPITQFTLRFNPNRR
jgi:hypothetical protein